MGTQTETALVSTERARLYLKAKGASDEELQELISAATELINASVNAPEVPKPLMVNAILQVAQNLYQRRASSLERANLGEDYASPYAHRPALDPLTPAWPLIRRWKKGTGIA